jgi:flagellar motor switch protein FliN/FliY
MTRPTVDRILHIEVPIVVLLGEKAMRLSEVLSLQPGMIIELPKRADSELDLHVNHTPVGMGLAVKVGENFGIRLTSIGSVQARISALAPELAAESVEPEVRLAG